MPYFDSYVRLEPEPPVADLDGGFAAAVADPAWFLARQWQLGEHRGEDAGSPVTVEFRAEVRQLDHATGADTQTVPFEAIVERSPAQWWTPSRRVRLGQELLERAEREDTALAERLRGEALTLADLPAPYRFLNGRGPDGHLLHARRAALGIPEAWFADLPAAASGSADAERWDTAQFVYRDEFRADRVRFPVENSGGSVHWYHFDASPATRASTVTEAASTAIPTRLNYAGAPAPRWWQLENRKFDVGGFPPDRSHFATMLLIDVVCSHSDDWFVFPVDSEQVGVGQFLTLTRVSVTDSFDEPHELGPPLDGWTIFETSGLPDPRRAAWSVLIPMSATLPLEGDPLDEVDLNIDEDANLLWATERRLAGVSTSGADDDSPRNLDPHLQADASASVAQRYEPSSPLQAHWHPYKLELPTLRDRYVESIEPVTDRSSPEE